MADVSVFTTRRALMRQKAIKSLLQGFHVRYADALGMKREALRLLALEADEDHLNAAIDALDGSVWGDLELSLFGKRKGGA